MSDVRDTVSDGLSSLDPTSGDNVFSRFDDTVQAAAGGDTSAMVDLITLGNANMLGVDQTYDASSDALADVDDAASGRDTQEAIEAAAEEAAAAQGDIASIYQQQLDTFKEMTAPYQEVGESFLPELQTMLTEGGRAGFMQRALDSQEFQNIAGAATDQLISNSAALGNRLSSGIQEDVLSTTGNLATQYAANAYNDRLNQLGQGVNIGLGTLGGSLSALQSSTAGQANALGNIANINLQAANAAAGMSNPLMGLLGAGAGALIGGPTGANIGYQVGSTV